MFLNDDNIFLSVLQFLISNLAKKGDEETLAHLSAETLSSLLIRCSVKKRIEPHCGVIVAELVKITNEIAVPSFFDLLTELTFQYKAEVGESIVDVMNALVQ